MRPVINILLLFLFMFAYSHVQAQTKAIQKCESFFNNSFISNGQYHSAILKKDETKKTSFTFLQGNTFRIAVCSEKSKKVVFTIYDLNNTILFTNKNHNYTQYWDFTAQNTMECTLSIYYEDENVSQDAILLVVGYKK